MVEPPRPRSIATRPGAHWLVVATVCVGALMGQLDASIVVMAIPTLQSAFHASLGAIEWVSLSYLLVLVAMVVAVGHLADEVGRKLIYIYGFVIFVIGSALCALAPALPYLIAFRALQALGASMLQANGVALIMQSMPRGQLGRGIGIQGAAQALGLCLGPVVGGALLALGGWRLIFWVNVPIGVLGSALGWFLLPRTRNLSERQATDWAGLGLFVLFSAGLLLALSSADDLGWTSPLVLISLAATVVSGAVFVRREKHFRTPMVQLSLFARRAFSAGISSALFCFLALFGTLFIFPFYLETSRHLSPARAGLELLALPLGLGLIAPLAGLAADRLGARLPSVLGMSLTALSLLGLALLHPSVGAVALLLGLTGIGLGLFIPPNSAAVMATVPKEHYGMASGILSMTRGMGTAMGVALTGLVFGLFTGTSVNQAHSPQLVSHGVVAAASFLAGAALLAAALSAMRGGRPPTPGKEPRARPAAAA